MGLFQFLRLNAPWLSAATLMTFVSSFGQTYFISVFAGEIRAEYGLSHGEWGNIYALGTMGSAALMVWAGALSDHYRVRTLGVMSLLLLSVAALGMALSKTSWILILVVFGLRFSGQGMVSHVSRVGVARWFVAERGRALALTALGYALGEALLPYLAVAWTPVLGWRVIWQIVAVVAILLIPLLLWLLRVERTPKSAAEAHSSEGINGRHWRRRDVLGHRLLWLTFPALTAPPMISTALFFHQVHLAEIKGWAHLDFVALLPVYVIAGIVALFVAGWAIDRFGAWRIYCFTQLPFALALVMIGQSSSLGMIGVAFVFMGMMQGAQSCVPAAFWAEAYGTKYLGAIKALTAAMMVLGSAVGPGLTGALIDAGIGFDRQLIGFGAYIVFGAVLAGVAVWQFRDELRQTAGAA